MRTESPFLQLELGDTSLRLQSWREEDVAELVTAVRESAEILGRWLPWAHPDYGVSDAESWVAFCQKGWLAGEHFGFAIIDADNGQLIGSMGLSQLGRMHRSANLGYWVRRSRQGESVAARAAIPVARFGFETLGLIRIEIAVQPDNLSSRRTAEKAGAKFEAICRQRLWVRDRPADAAIYSLIPQDLA